MKPTTNNQQQTTSTHFQLSPQWRALKESVGNKTFSFNGGWFQTTKLPFINKYIGYAPPIDFGQIDWNDLYTNAKKAGCIYVTIDSEEVGSQVTFPTNTPYTLIPTQSVRLQHNVIIDLTKSEDELSSAISKKVRYLIRNAVKQGVTVTFSDSEESFNTFLQLFLETKKRHKFYGRGEHYLRNVWKIFRENKASDTGTQEEETKEQQKRSLNGESIPATNNQQLSTQPSITIATAYYNEFPLASWMLIGSGGTLYYPYGGSSVQFKKVLASYALAWETIKWAKAHGYQTFDMMGLESDRNGNPDKDGFSAFKAKFGGQIITYTPSANLVISPLWYKIMRIGYFLRNKFSIIKNKI